MSPLDPAPEELADTLDQVTQKYLALKASVASCPRECFADIPVHSVPDKTQEEPFKEAVAHYADRLSIQQASLVTPPHPLKKTAVSPEELTVENSIALEKHRLSIWLAKAAVLLMAAIVLVVLFSVATLVHSSKAITETALLSAMFSNLNDLLLTILNAGATP